MNIIRLDMDEFDELVKKTYGKPYMIQQQNGCRPRNTLTYTVPKSTKDFTRKSMDYKINGPLYGINFKVWKEEEAQSRKWEDLWWERNFYPKTQILLNDLHSKGLIKSGKYKIKLDW